ncbi:MAG: hypothetical protein A3K19_33010 [Lentisphaerae bacterium RIFOXYB12_FULL_65_16]|nr:MAG: hypothetical protein A3K18_31645 [Lentisphaerae bacterium RIFOXYA12_64_32]OGV87008.1 MAG: hypothetical protein A3K19_33010 [Lentisphaerae bacterium RIFOXYB12_FULL_65_16]
MAVDREKFRTGIPVLDQQRDQLLDTIERLLDLCKRGQIAEGTLEAEAGAVIDYAVEHFDAEEYLMQLAQYPYFAQHVSKHDEFRDQIETVLVELRTCRWGEVGTLRLATFLVQWFCQHVQAHDVKLATFLKAMILEEPSASEALAARSPATRSWLCRMLCGQAGLRELVAQSEWVG